MTDLYGSIGIFGVLFAIFLAILWTLLPFAVFGVKSRLDDQTKLLKDIRDELIKSNLHIKKKKVINEGVNMGNVLSAPENITETTEDKPLKFDYYK